MKKQTLALLTFAILLASGPLSWGAPGDLDTGFDGDGKVMQDLGLDDAATGVALQSDGKILVVSYSAEGGVVEVVVSRFNSNGSPDTTFGTDGSVVVEAPGSFEPDEIKLQ